MIKKLKIDKSTCGQFIRLSFAGCIEILTISEWSKTLGSTGVFQHEIDETPVSKPDFVLLKDR